LAEIGLAVYEEMSFEVKVYRMMPDEKLSQKLNMSLCSITISCKVAAETKTTFQ
jgi:hypothetical protein